jgi:BlaI family transcriptional regulator, penicillinase repressor
LFSAADSLLNNALDGTVGPLLAYMAKKSSMTAEELTELRELLDQLAPPAEDDA